MAPAPIMTPMNSAVPSMKATEGAVPAPTKALKYPARAVISAQRSCLCTASR